MKKAFRVSVLLFTVMLCVIIGACKSENYTKGLKFEKTNGYYTVVIDSKLSDNDVVIPSKYKSKPVKAIGRCAFFGYELTSVVISDSIECIDDMAFAYCKSLSSVTMGKNVNKIVGGAFGHCSSLTSIIIPDKVTAIELNTFYECTQLSSITIGKGVVAVNDGAFYNCISLRDVYYQGNKTEWDKISIDSTNNDCLLNATIHYVD